MIISKTPFRISFFGGGTDSLLGIKKMEGLFWLQLLISIAILPVDIFRLFLTISIVLFIHNMSMLIILMKLTILR